MKACNQCGATKPLDDFYTSHTNRDGRMGHCKACHRKRTAAAKREHRARVRARRALRRMTEGAPA